MTHTKKILLSLLALAACGNVLQAQDAAPRHEVSATFQGLGLGSMPFSGSQTWNDQPGLSLGFGAGYTYWFGSHFGFKAGLRMNRLSYNQEISGLDMPVTASLPMSSLGLPGGSGLTTVNFIAKASSVQEERQYTFVELPLMLAMRCGQWYLDLGLSLAKAVSATADYSYSDPSCSIAELPELGVTPATPVPMTLTGEKEGGVKNRNMPKPFYCLLAAEAGYNIPVGDAASLSVGLFGRYAPVADKTKDAVDAYAIQPDATYSLVQPSTSTMAEKKGYYEVGLSIGVNLGIAKKKRQADTQSRPVMTSGDDNAAAMADELAAAKKARAAAERELAAAKAAREKAESELSALESARKKAESDMDAYRRSLDAQQNVKTNPQHPETTPSSNTNTTAPRQIDKNEGLVFYFDFNKTKPISDGETEAKLRSLCENMKGNAGLKVDVIGHTDNVGTKRNNNKVGRKRAKAVKRMMLDMGAPEESINVTTRGESEPTETNQTNDGRAKNRRVTVKVQ